MIRIKAIVALVLGLAMSATVVLPAAHAHDEDAEEFGLSVIVKLEADTPVEVLFDVEHTTDVEPLLASRGIYRVRSELLGALNDKGEIELHGDAKKWRKAIEKVDQVLWAEADLDIAATDTRFHSWQFRSMSAGDFEYSGIPASPDQPAFAELALTEAHQTTTGDGVRVAILDTGVDKFHELLIGRIAGEYDLVDDDTDASEVSNGIDDDLDGSIDEAYGHGTFVAGVVAQVAPDAQLYALRVSNDDGVAQIYSLIEAIDLAIELDVDVINMSFGLIDYKKFEALDDAIKRAKDAEIIIVAAAGNLGDERRSYPASNKYVVSVAAAATEGDALASFSSRGKWVRLAAPGVDIVSSIPGGYAEWAGTSMATPVASGALALLLEADTSGKPKEAIKALLEEARHRGDKDTDKGMLDLPGSIARVS